MMSETSSHLPLDGKHVLIVVGGGIAACKSVDIVRRCMKHGAQVRVLMTRAGSFFVHPTTFAAITGRRVGLEMFSAEGNPNPDHLEFAHWADLVLVAPATADLMAKMAHGIADDLATTALLATTCPVVIAPAMNTSMFQHPATQANLATLRQRGVQVIGPESGDLAAPGEKAGIGRMTEPAEIVARLVELLAPQPQELPLTGKRVVITAGRTEEPIDAVRLLTNRSSGRMGAALAEAALSLGAEVVLVHGAMDVDLPVGVEGIRIQTADQLLQACEKVIPDADLVFYAAAVSDWKPAPLGEGKSARTRGEPPVLQLTENPDVAASTSRLGQGFKVAFALQDTLDVDKARLKRREKGVDAILLNQLDAMGATKAEYVWVADGEPWGSGEKPKTELASWAVRQALEAMQNRKQ